MSIKEMIEQFSNRDNNLFEDWWQRSGRAEDQKPMAQDAFLAALAISRNYVADDSDGPLRFVFANGRVVSLGDKGYLVVGQKN